VSVESDLALGQRIRDAARGGWFTKIGIRSLAAHFFPTKPDGTPKRIALCGADRPAHADGDERWRCKSCERRRARIEGPAVPRGGAARRYDS
jgi:hypothetical protein